MVTSSQMLTKVLTKWQKRKNRVSQKPIIKRLSTALTVKSLVIKENLTVKPSIPLLFLVEMNGIEPSTCTLRTYRSPN